MISCIAYLFFCMYLKNLLIVYTYICVYIHPMFLGFITRWCQCTRFNNFFPCVSVLCLPFQNGYFLVTPFLYIAQPFSFWSSSFCFHFHLSEHHLLYQSVIFHSTALPK